MLLEKKRWLFCLNQGKIMLKDIVHSVMVTMYTFMKLKIVEKLCRGIQKTLDHLLLMKIVEKLCREIQKTLDHLLLMT